MDLDQLFSRLGYKQTLNLLSQEGCKISFSQFGEDLIVLAILSQYGRLESGFYVDLGAHHPYKYSNTALLSSIFKWDGICVDADESAIEKINAARSSTNLSIGVGETRESRNFAVFNHPAVNTFDPSMVSMYSADKNSPFEVIANRSVEIYTLEQILTKYLPDGQEINFMSVDLEGFDYAALKSNNWEKYRPFLIAVEIHGMDLSNVNTNEAFCYLTKIGYRFISHCYATSFFILK